jgi:DNA-binding protein H-NS
MPTYLELKEQAEKLLAQAEQMRERETEEAIADIKAKIRAYGLTAQDLGLATTSSGQRAPRKAAAKKSSAPAKYRGPNGESWSGGRGRKPQWVVDALARGRKLEDFEIR